MKYVALCAFFNTSVVTLWNYFIFCLSALMLLIGGQKGHLAHKNFGFNKTSFDIVMTISVKLTGYSPSSLWVWRVWSVP